MTNDTFCTMRSLGKVLGVTSHVIGRQLKSLGLRTPDGQPSELAKEMGLVQCVQGPQPWVLLWLWDREPTIALLQAADFVDQPISVGDDR